MLTASFLLLQAVLAVMIFRNGSGAVARKAAEDRGTGGSHDPVVAPGAHAARIFTPGTARNGAIPSPDRDITARERQLRILHDLLPATALRDSQRSGQHSPLALTGLITGHLPASATARPSGIVTASKVPEFQPVTSLCDYRADPDCGE